MKSWRMVHLCIKLKRDATEVTSLFMAFRQKLWVQFSTVYIHFLTQIIMILMIDAVFPVYCMIHYDLESTTLTSGYPLGAATMATS